VRRQALRLTLLVSLALGAPGAASLLFPTALDAQSPTVLLNEFMPAPMNVDWDGDGTANNQDESIVCAIETARSIWSS
jgi:hypothetical protein